VSNMHKEISRETYGTLLRRPIRFMCSKINVLEQSGELPFQLRKELGVRGTETNFALLLSMWTILNTKFHCNLLCFLEGTNMKKNNHVDEDIRFIFQFHVFLTKHALIVSVNKSQAKCDFNLRTLSRRDVINLCCTGQLLEYLLL
jgi:hypothetical protein